MSMEAYFITSKPEFFEADPLYLLFPSDFSNTTSMKALLQEFFNCSKAFTNKYQSSKDLWEGLLYERFSQKENVLAILTKDSYLIIFDLSKITVHIMEVPIAKEMQLCGIDIAWEDIVIGGFYEALIINWRNRTVHVLDFYISTEIKAFDLGPDVSKQAKIISVWKRRSRVAESKYSGEFRCFRSNNGTIIKGMIGMIYTREEFDLLCKDNLKEVVVRPNCNTNHFVLCLTEIAYTRHEVPYIHQKVMFIEFSPSEIAPSIILRANDRCEVTMIVLNSSYKYLSQILTFKTSSKAGAKFRFVSIISGADTLPNDEYGRTSMTAINICWTYNNLFAVIYFLDNYYCIVTCLGQPLSLLNNNIMQVFHVIPAIKKDVKFTKLKVMNRTMIAFGSQAAVSIEFKTNLYFPELWKAAKLASNFIRILWLILAFPKFTVDNFMLDTLEQAMNSEVVCFMPNKKNDGSETTNNSRVRRIDRIHKRHVPPPEDGVDNTSKAKINTSGNEQIKKEHKESIWKFPAFYKMEEIKENTNEIVKESQDDKLQSYDNNNEVKEDQGAGLIREENKRKLEKQAIDLVDNKVKLMLSGQLDKDIVKEIQKNLTVGIKEESDLDNMLSNFIEENKEEEIESNVSCAEFDQLSFKNVFSVNINNGIKEIVKGGLLVSSGLCWSTGVCNNIHEMIINEIENFHNLLYLKGEPTYFIHAFLLYRKLTQGISTNFMINNLKVYMANVEFLNEVTTSHKDSFTFGKKKALLLLYCFIQFRNFKATSLNIFYILLAGVLYSRWGHDKTVDTTINSIVSQLKYTKLIKGKKEENNGFFEIDQKMCFADCSEMLCSLLSFFEKAFLEKTKQPDIDPALKKKMQRHNKKFILAVAKLYDEDSMKRLSAIIRGIVNKDEEVIEQIDELMNTREGYMNYLYNCAYLLQRGKLDTVFWQIKSLVGTRLNSSSENSLILAIVFTCLSLVVFTMSEEGKRTIKLYEVQTFFYKVLLKADLVKVFEQLTEPADIKSMKMDTLHIPSLECSTEEQELYNKMAILFQLSKEDIAIELLLNSSQPYKILLGHLILNNKLNESLIAGKEELGKEYMKITIRKLKQLIKRHLYDIAREIPKHIDTQLWITPNIFSTCMVLSGKTTGVTIAYLALPALVTQLKDILDCADISPERVTQLNTAAAFTIEACPFMQRLASSFSESPVTLCNKLLATLFSNPHHAIVFNCLLQESAQIIAACTKTGIMDFLCVESSKCKFIRLSSGISSKVAYRIKKTGMTLLKLIWEVVLLLTTEELKKTDLETLSSVDKMRFAGHVIRLSLAGKDEQQELEYLHCGLDLLKKIDYTQFPTDSRKEIKILANVFNIYIGKWNTIISNDKQTVLNLIKEKNAGLYEELKCNLYCSKFITMMKDKSATLKYYLNSDVIFRNSLGSLKATINWLISEEGSLRKHVERGKVVRGSFRKALNEVVNVTGIPSNMTISKEEWCLKESNTFNEVNDINSADSIGFKIMREVFDGIDEKAECKSKDLMEKRSIRINRTDDISLDIRRNTEAFNNTIINGTRIRLKKIQSRSNETFANCFIQKEMGIGKVISVVCKNVSKHFTEFSRLFNIASKCNYRQLTCTNKKIKFKILAPSAIKNANNIKPFFLFSMKKPHLSKANVYNSNNNTTNTVLTDEGLKFSESVFAINKFSTTNVVQTKTSQNHSAITP